MKASRQKFALPAAFSAVSFLSLVVLLLLTSPVNNISYAVAFFIALPVFLVSFGYVVALLQAGQIGRKARGRIWLFAIFVALLLMFRSAGSLNLVDGLVLILIIGGLVFYASRRP